MGWLVLAQAVATACGVQMTLSSTLHGPTAWPSSSVIAHAQATHTHKVTVPAHIPASSHTAGDGEVTEYEDMPSRVMQAECGAGQHELAHHCPTFESLLHARCQQILTHQVGWVSSFFWSLGLPPTHPSPTHPARSPSIQHLTQHSAPPAHPSRPSTQQPSFCHILTTRATCRLRRH